MSYNKQTGGYDPPDGDYASISSSWDSLKWGILSWDVSSDLSSDQEENDVSSDQEENEDAVIKGIGQQG